MSENPTEGKTYKQCKSWAVMPFPKGGGCYEEIHNQNTDFCNNILYNTYTKSKIAPTDQS